MKTLTKNSIFCFISLFVMVMSACKKEKDDPNITQFTYNRTITNPGAYPSSNVDSLDVNQDGAFDLYFIIERETADSQYVAYEADHLALHLTMHLFLADLSLRNYFQKAICLPCIMR